MRNLLLGTLFACAITTSLNASVNENENAFESCISIAADIADGDSDLFAAAYNACIRARCDCDL